MICVSGLNCRLIGYKIYFAVMIFVRFVHCACVAFGCADLTYVGNAWTRRTGETIMVRCNVTGETYFLTCRDSAWKGELYNCSQGTGDVRYTSDATRRWINKFIGSRPSDHYFRSVCLSVCLFVQSFSQPSLIRFRSN